MTGVASESGTRGVVSRVAPATVQPSALTGRMAAIELSSRKPSGRDARPPRREFLRPVVQVHGPADLRRPQRIGAPAAGAAGSLRPLSRWWSMHCAWRSSQAHKAATSRFAQPLRISSDAQKRSRGEGPRVFTQVRGRSAPPARIHAAWLAAAPCQATASGTRRSAPGWPCG